MTNSTKQKSVPPAAPQPATLLQKVYDWRRELALVEIGRDLAEACYKVRLSMEAELDRHEMAQFEAAPQTPAEPPVRDSGQRPVGGSGEPSSPSVGSSVADPLCDCGHRASAHNNGPDEPCSECSCINPVYLS